MVALRVTTDGIRPIFEAQEGHKPHREACGVDSPESSSVRFYRWSLMKNFIELIIALVPIRKTYL